MCRQLLPMYVQGPPITPQLPLTLFLCTIACLSVGTEISHSRVADSQPPPTTTHSDIRMWNWSDAATFRLGKGVARGPDKAEALSPDENYLAFVSGNSIWIYDFETASRLTQLNDGHTTVIKSLAYSPNGLILAAGTGHGKVQLLDVKSGKVLDSLTRHEPDSEVYIVAFSPHGKTLASGARGGIEFWNIETRAHLVTLRGHKNRIAALAFSPNGETLAFRAEDDTVKLWEIATGKNLATFKYPRHVSVHYIRATEHFKKAKTADKDLKKTEIESVIAVFRYIVTQYADTKYADLSLVEIGKVYMILSEEEDAYLIDALDYFDKLWVKYLEEPPVDAQVAKALRYAQSQVATITSIMESNNIYRRTTGVPE